MVQKFLHDITFPWLAYAGLFLGVAFLSGAIVHLPWDPVRYGLIGCIGALLFVLATLYDEKVVKKRSLLSSDVVQIILWSLVLSIGLGMVSGGIQHFLETPHYAAYLVPIGTGLSLAAFAKRFSLVTTRGHAWYLVVKGVALVLILFVALQSLAYSVEPRLDVHADGEVHEHTSFWPWSDEQEPVDNMLRSPRDQSGSAPAQVQ